LISSKGSGAGRIGGETQGRETPLFGAPNDGPRSPSAALRIEQHALTPLQSETHVLNDQLVTLILDPVTVEHSVDDGPATAIPLSAIIRDSARSIGRSRGAELVPTPRSEDPQSRRLLVAINEERCAGFPLGALVVDGIADALAAALIGSFAAPTAQGGDVRPLSAKELRHVIEFMQAHLQLPIGLNELAAVAAMSRAHFAHRFRAATNDTPHHALLRFRIERCKQLLGNPAHTMLAVATEAGFRNPQHMATAFRRATGVSPSAYRTSVL
jgi:AraC family transcriptional regulator